MANVTTALCDAVYWAVRHSIRNRVLHPDKLETWAANPREPYSGWPSRRVLQRVSVTRRDLDGRPRCGSSVLASVEGSPILEAPMAGWNLAHLAIRTTAGAFILNAGLGKWSGDAQTAAGVHGMAALGLATEVSKLTASERRMVMDWTAEDTDGRVPLAFTIFGSSVAEQVAQVHHAESAGADWVILQPPPVRNVVVSGPTSTAVTFRRNRMSTPRSRAFPDPW